MTNPPEQPSPLSWLSTFFKGPAHLVYFITLNLDISASRQNIKNLISNFGAIHVGIMHAKFQAFSFTGVGGEWGDRLMHDITPDLYTKFLNSPFPSHALLREGLVCQVWKVALQLEFTSVKILILKFQIKRMREQRSAD